MSRYEQGPFNPNIFLEEAKRKLITIGFLIEADAKRIQTEFPYVDTRRSVASISTNWTDSGMNRGEVERTAGIDDGIGNPGEGVNGEFTVVVGSNVEYFPYLELGTRHLAPAAMLRRAFERYASLLREMGR